MSRYAVQIVGPAGRVTWLDDEGEETDYQDKAKVFGNRGIADEFGLAYRRSHKGLYIFQAVDLDAEPRDG